MKISSNFDSGNIEVVEAENNKNIQLKIRKDTNADFFQWFYFHLTGEKNALHVMNIINAGESSYPPGWENYRACASYDRIKWFRVPTKYDGKVLSIVHIPEYKSVYYSYFAPYSYERHLDLISRAQQSKYCKPEFLGETVEGREITLLTAGEDSPGKKKIWIFARQHPGETMAEWFIEGMLERLLDNDDALSKELLKKAVFYIVPNMNPDGSINGNLRANSAGANLNREWLNPSPERSPEVYYVREKMHITGVNLALDIHGDEALPYNFMATSKEIPEYTEKMKELDNLFIENLIRVNPDFQNKFGYEDEKFKEEQLKLATNYIGKTFQCPSMTLEMPFKDNADSPDEKYGWSPERSKKLGKSVLDSVYYIIDKI